MTRLGDLVDMTFGFAFKSAEFTDSRDAVRLLRGDNIGQGRLRWDGAKWFPQERVDEVTKYQLAIGDVVLAMDRPWIEAGLKYSVVRSGDVPSLLVQRVARLRAKPALDQGYLAAVIGSKEFMHYIVGTQTGSAVPHISGGQIGDFQVDRLPPLAEQAAIARILGVIDDKIESNRHIIATSEELARAWFSQQFDLQRVDGGVALADLVAVNPGRKLPHGVSATYVGMSSLPEFSAEIYEWETRDAGSGQRFTNGDVLMARITPCLENGKTAVVDMLEPQEVGWGSTEYVVVAPSGRYSTAWIYCLVRDERVREFAIRSMTGTSGRQRFHADRFQQYRVDRPTDEALDAFNAATEPLFTRMTQCRDENRRLHSLRDALLPELLSGRIRVPVEESAA